MDAFELFKAKDHLLLPRVLCYFDDILGYTYSDWNGERLAISEFNATYTMRKISPIYGLRYFAPSPLREAPEAEAFYYFHFFDHPRYTQPDSLRKVTAITMEGEEIDSISTQVSITPTVLTRHNETIAAKPASTM
jgi:hypothetical protein